MATATQTVAAGSAQAQTVRLGRWTAPIAVDDQNARQARETAAIAEGLGKPLLIAVDPRKVPGFDASLCHQIEAALALARQSLSTAPSVFASAGDIPAPRPPALILSTEWVEADRAGHWPLPDLNDDPLVLNAALGRLVLALEAFPLPVLFVASGTVLGPAAALALACTARVAPASARIGFPEAGYGLCPMAGAGLRLARQIGPEQALRLVLTARAIPAAEALALGLLDRVVAQGVPSAVAAELLDLTSATEPRLPPTAATRWSRNAGHWLEITRTARARLATQRVAGPRPPAPERIVDSIEAGLLMPPDLAMAHETAVLEDLALGPEAAALIHVARAERAAARPIQRPLPKLETVGVMGASAAALAQALAEAGMQVRLVETDRPRLVGLLETIAGRAEQSVSAGRITPAQRDAQWARISPAAGPEALADCQIVLVGDSEALHLAAAATPAGTVLALTGRGAGLQGPRAPDMLGMRLHGARLAELIAGPETGRNALGLAQLLAQALGRVAVVVPAPGGVAAQVMLAGRAAVQFLITRLGRDAVARALQSEALSLLMPAEPGAAGAEPEAAAADTKLETMAAPQILGRVLAAMANASARALGERRVHTGGEIDLSLVLGQGFPRILGGPCHWADQRGLLILRRDLELWAAEAPELWTPAPAISDYLSAGKRLGG